MGKIVEIPIFPIFLSFFCVLFGLFFLILQSKQTTIYHIADLLYGDKQS